METGEVVRGFYEALGRKDEAWKDRLGGDVIFSDASGKLQARGREAFIQSFTSFLRAVEKVELNQLIVDGSRAAAVVSYDYVNRQGDHLHQADAEIWHVEDGRILSLTIYFDLTEFRAFMAN